MELRHLTYFIAVAEELHFRRAAARLHVAQPAVSEQVRRLERELGVRLFDRTSRSVALTEAGAALLVEARRVLRQAEAARLAARNAQGRASGSLRIGYVPSSLPGSVPRALRRLAVTMPRLNTTLQPGFGPELVDAVRAEELDAAIVSLPAATVGLRTSRLADQRAVAAFPIGHEHANKPEVHLAQLATERMLVLPRDADRPFHDALIAACRHAAFAPTLVEMPDGHVERALLAVASGAGILLLPEGVTERYGAAGVRFVALAGAAPVLTTAVVSRRDSRHMPTEAFLRTIARTHAHRHLVAVHRGQG